MNESLVSSKEVCGRIGHVGAEIIVRQAEAGIGVFHLAFANLDAPLDLLVGLFRFLQICDEDDFFYNVTLLETLKVHLVDRGAIGLAAIGEDLVTEGLGPAVILRRQTQRYKRATLEHSRFVTTGVA